MTHEEKYNLWHERFQRQKESGLTITAWCEQNQIAQSQFYYWQKKITASPSEADNAIIPISIPASIPTLVIETPNGYRISVNDISVMALLPQIMKGLS